MANLLTPLQIVNQAFRNLGELPITSFTDATNPRSLLAAQFYISVRDDLLTEHFWNFATKRVILLPYSEPAGTLTPAAVSGSGITFTTSITGVFGLDAVGKRLVGDGVAGEATIAGLVSSTPVAALTPAAGALIPGQTGVIFTAGAAVLAGADVGKIIENLAGLGVARITAFTDTTHVVATILTAWETLTAMPSASWRLVRTDQVTANISSAFASTAAIPAGSWRLYNATPAWGFQYALTLPSDYLRMQRIDESRIYQREGDYLLTSEISLPLTYTAQITDVTRYAPGFVQALVATLASEFAGQIADLSPKRDLWLKLAAVRLRKAKKDDGQEGSAPQLEASDLIAARRGGFPRTWPRWRN
jgi:hypothetical protein